MEGRKIRGKEKVKKRDAKEKVKKEIKQEIKKKEKRKKRRRRQRGKVKSSMREGDANYIFKSVHTSGDEPRRKSKSQLQKLSKTLRTELTTRQAPPQHSTPFLGSVKEGGGGRRRGEKMTWEGVLGAGAGWVGGAGRRAAC